MTLEDKINKVISKFKHTKPYEDIVQWGSNPYPFSLYYVTRHPLKSIEYLKVDILIRDATYDECMASKSYYIRDLKRRWFSNNDLQQRWVQTYHKRTAATELY